MGQLIEPYLWTPEATDTDSAVSITFATDATVQYDICGWLCVGPLSTAGQIVVDLTNIKQSDGTVGTFTLKPEIYGAGASASAAGFNLWPGLGAVFKANGATPPVVTITYTGAAVTVRIRAAYRIWARNVA